MESYVAGVEFVDGGSILPSWVPVVRTVICREDVHLSASMNYALREGRLPASARKLQATVEAMTGSR